MKETRSARIVVKVQPSARQNEVLRFQDEVWHVRVAAPPVKGRANHELVKFLSDILGVSQGRVTIERGVTSRTKVISIGGLTQEQVMLRLGKLVIDKKAESK